jgi:hypothetical protein
MPFTVNNVGMAKFISFIAENQPGNKGTVYHFSLFHPIQRVLTTRISVLSLFSQPLQEELFYKTFSVMHPMHHPMTEH